MKNLILASLISLLIATAQAQTPPNSCAVGGAINSTLANIGQSCSPVVGLVGNYISKTNQTAAMGAQTICDTSNTCPAGFVTLNAYVNPVTTGTLVSATTAQITYTDDVGTKTMPLGGALSLTTNNPGSYVFSFLHAANTAVTVQTTTTTLTGSPSYNFRAQLTWLNGP